MVQLRSIYGPGLSQNRPTSAARAEIISVLGGKCNLTETGPNPNSVEARGALRPSTRVLSPVEPPKKNRSRSHQTCALKSPAR